MIKILIVDDMVIFRESLRFIMEQDEEISVIGCAGNGEEAAKLCEKLSPDLVLMDLMMPVCDGVEGTKLIKSRHKDIKVLVLTTFNDNIHVSNALKNGADGYVLKEVKPDELISAVKSVSKGFNIVHRDIFNTMVENLSSEEKKEPIKENKTDFKLTEREKKIIQLIVDGKSNRQIALTLSFAEGSVKNIITGILNKLNLKDRTQLAIFAIKNDLI